MLIHISRFLRFPKAGASALGFMCIILAASPAQSLQGRGDRITFIHQFLRTMYPELLRPRLQMTIEEQQSFAAPTYVSGKHLSTFVVKLVPAPPCSVQLPPRKGSADQGRPAGRSEEPIEAFAGVFQFSDGELTNYYSGSKLVSWERLASVMRLVDQHSEWSDEQVLHALAQAGAKYTPGNRKEFLRSIPKTALQEIFGPLKITSVQFLIRDKEQLQAGLQSADLFWRVNASSGQSQFHLDFEPFGGKLLRVLILPEGPAPAVQRERAPQPPHGGCSQT